MSLRWEGDSTSVDLMYNKFEEDSDRSRITNQICAQNPLPTYGCISDEFGRDGINPGSSTGTMYISFGGIFPLGQNSAALAALGFLNIQDLKIWESVKCIQILNLYSNKNQIKLI